MNTVFKVNEGARVNWRTIITCMVVDSDYLFFYFRYMHFRFFIDPHRVVAEWL